MFPCSIVGPRSILDPRITNRCRLDIEWTLPRSIPEDVRSCPPSADGFARFNLHCSRASAEFSDNSSRTLDLPFNDLFED